MHIHLGLLIKWFDTGMPSAPNDANRFSYFIYKRYKIYIIMTKQSWEMVNGVAQSGRRCFTISYRNNY